MMGRRHFSALILAFAMVGAAMPTAQAETNVMFIVDASGSMKKAVETSPAWTRPSVS